jgi:transcriptional regulator with XRE-family HTH domain
LSTLEYVKRVEPVQPNFGIRIKKLRFDANLSQQELAELCELSVDQIANIERGKNFASETTIAMLAAALGMGNDHQKLFDYSENEAFVKSGGMKWRAGRQRSVLLVHNRKVDVTIQESQWPGKKS